MGFSPSRMTTNYKISSKKVFYLNNPKDVDPSSILKDGSRFLCPHHKMEGHI